jgi:hypothetical protein
MKQKQSISNSQDAQEKLTPVLEELLNRENGFKVPFGYFDSLSPRIIDRINKRSKTSSLHEWISKLIQPVVWAPTVTSVLVVLLLVFVIPSRNTPTLPATDEWTEINMAYDASYAEESLLTDGHQIDSELEGIEINYSEPAIVSGQGQLTHEEISKYLQEHEMESELLTEY